MSEIWLIRSTFGNIDEAISTARSLLENKLVACANIDQNMTALFRWEGLIQQESEIVLLTKTTPERVASAMTHIKSLHSYQIPSILAWPTGASNAEFAEWVAAEVA